MAKRLFGTDGIRGEANAKLTAELALSVGLAAGHWFRSHAGGNGRPFAVIGRDTRLSGEMLSCAVSAGLASMGVDVRDIGIAPTPAVARVVIAEGAAAGVVISASHNPFQDNGIKLFGPSGSKLPDDVEDHLQALMEDSGLQRPLGAAMGSIGSAEQLCASYAEQVKATVGPPGSRPLKGLKLVLDCANGAAYRLAPAIFESLGAEVTLLHASPNGTNINLDCGSTHPDSLAAKVRESGADAGVAFDGDADRTMFADAAGNIVDGDKMMAIIGGDLHDRGALPGDVVVATIMSNVGLEQALARKSIRLHRTAVGDRYVSAAMEELHAAIGGEQSGHILLPNITPTGDGMVTALQVLGVMVRKGRTLADLGSVVEQCPQLLRNVRVKSREGWDTHPSIQAAISAGAQRLGNENWLSVRPSGTEPLIRVMAQGLDADTVTSVVGDICTELEARLGKA